MSVPIALTRPPRTDAAADRLRVLLVSAFDLGHQPFGLASPAAWLSSQGAVVACLDLAVQKLDEAAVREADLIGFYLPMHTATRILAGVVPRVRELNPDAHLCAYGLYAPVNQELLQGIGIDSIIGGEFEEPLADLARHLRPRQVNGQLISPPQISLGRQDFQVPDRSGLPALSDYAFVTLPDGTRRVVGYTEATRGCKHLCRHCPIVPVYGGQFRVVQRDIVLADIRQQVAAGAQHITFGDPDFFNGPAHATAIVQALHEEFPDVTYDVIIKVQHLVAHRDRLPILRQTGCILVTSAVESVDENILEYFDKRHTREDFASAVTTLRDLGIGLNPTFVAFTPWTTMDGYLRFLTEIDELGLVENVTPIQFAIRLLIPEGSKLLDLPDVRDLVEPFDPVSLVYPWTHPDPAVDALQRDVLALTAEAVGEGRPRAVFFDQLWALANAAAGQPGRSRAAGVRPISLPVPQFSEPWYCCAEPTETQLAPPV
ncbi:CUAEP/CCAEP-tail radical SAM (seleno)protein [Catenulispora rubra]|uniref:CUAEP/CCAEP-tail radical SAM (seleno)protein n=1 Tax=Catenulispora rubra TaxID=280293 RepID=UPI0018921C98|nr:CUAEP/CCAEP-tail radical SAM protein [Catenulispora rubra]